MDAAVKEFFLALDEAAVWTNTSHPKRVELLFGNAEQSERFIAARAALYAAHPELFSTITKEPAPGPLEGPDSRRLFSSLQPKD